MKEMMQGTVLVTEQAIARKVGAGWLIKSRVGKIWDSVRFQAPPGEKTNLYFVKTKTEVRRVLRNLEKQYG